MDLEIAIPSEVSQKKKINITWYHLYAESEPWHGGTYLQNRLSDVEKKLVVVKGEEAGEEKDGEFGFSRCNYYL